MSEVKLEHRGNVAVLRLSHETTNAIGPGLVEDMSRALDDIRTGFKGVVLAGGEKFFSIGLDLPQLLELDRSAMTDFWYRLNDLALDLYTLPFPTLCAIEGHAVAGGAVLALTCDYRFAGTGKGKVGFNEIKLGLPVPYLADLILGRVVGERAAREMLYQGRFMSITEALEIGFIDECLSEGRVEDEVVERASEMAALPESAFAVIKGNRVESVRSMFEKNRDLKHKLFLDCWFSESVQGLLRRASETF